MSDLTEQAAIGAALRTEIEDLVERIRKAPVKVLARLKTSLGTKDVESTVSLVRADPQAQAVARAVLGSAPQEAAAPEITIATGGSGRSRPTRRGSIKF